MSEERDYAKLILVDTNRFFVKRLSEALHKEGFEVIHSAEAAYALTAVEWNMPVAILCATNLANSDVYAIPHIVQADERTKHIAVVALGESGDASLLDAFRAGYDHFIERRFGAQEIAGNLVSFLLGRRHRLQFSQTLDVLRTIQSISAGGDTGALRVKSAAWEGIVFFKAGQVMHAESGTLVGDAAVRYMIQKSSISGWTYRFLRGCAIPGVRTVHETVERIQE